MQFLTFLKPVLHKLDDGNVIRSSIALVLQMLAIFTLVAAVFLIVYVLKEAFQLPGVGPTVGGLIFALIFVVTALSVYQIFTFRARNIRDLGESPFTVIPIFSILFRAVGEIYAALGIAVGVGGCLFIWLAQLNPMYLLGGVGGLLPSLSPDSTFLGGILFLVYLGIASFLVLIVFYFLAEASLVMVDIAKHIRLLAKHRTDI